MRYEISQKLFSFGDDFAIRNQHGEQSYYVDGKAFTFGKKLSVLDRSKREVAFISQKLFKLTPTFQITRQNKTSAIFKKKLFTFRPQFILDVPGPHDYDVVGDFIGHEYTIRHDGRDVARISKRFFAATDSYGVDISGGDHLLCLCTAIIIDLVLHKNRRTPH